MHKTKVQEKLGLDWPIVQGPFGGASTVKLTSIVSNMGGLGSFGAYMMEPAAIAKTIGELKDATSKPFAVNLWASDHDPGGLSLSQDEFDRAFHIYAPLYKKFSLPKASYHPRFEKQAEALLEARPPAFSFVFGVPNPLILSECKRLGIVTIGAATTVSEAEALHTVGVDLIVASGFEGAGHRPSFLARAEDSLMGALALTRAIVTRIDTPVISAGGIADGAGIRAALALGAGAAQIGTAFFACNESGASEVQRHAIFSAAQRPSVLTRAYSGRLARGYANRTTQEMARTHDSFPPFPIHSWFMAKIRAAATAANDPEWSSLYAGQGAPLVKHTKAADLMQALIADLKD